MEQRYSIRSVADKYGVTARTLRYYEEEGLLTSTRKENSAYREYTEEQIIRLEIVLFLRKLSFSIDDILSLLEGNSETFSKVLDDKIKKSNIRLSNEQATNNLLYGVKREISNYQDISVSRLFLDLPYISQSLERMIPMKSLYEEKYRIAIGLGIVMDVVNKNAGDLIGKIKDLREKMIDLPPIRVYDSPDLPENQVLIVWNGQELWREDFLHENIELCCNKIIEKIANA